MAENIYLEWWVKFKSAFYQFLFGRIIEYIIVSPDKRLIFPTIRRSSLSRQSTNIFQLSMRKKRVDLRCTFSA